MLHLFINLSILFIVYLKLFSIFIWLFVFFSSIYSILKIQSVYKALNYTCVNYLSSCYAFPFHFLNDVFDNHKFLSLTLSNLLLIFSLFRAFYILYKAFHFSEVVKIFFNIVLDKLMVRLGPLQSSLSGSRT